MSGNRRRISWVAGIFVAATTSLVPAAGSAEEVHGPVVVELYTSQGCAACPPADDMMQILAARDDVIALALHVDYWDYIGWKDIFAHPEHAERQRGFARRMGLRMIYTPQMIIDGAAHVVGNKPMQVSDLIRKHKDSPDPVRVTLQLSDGRLGIRAHGTVRGPVDVHLVRFQPAQSVEITRGENRGKTLQYVNIVRSWSVIGTWDGTAPLDVSADIDGDAPLAVLLQVPDQGPIVGAAALR